jgi:tRNA pseudouridine(38-40) synthase
MFLRMFYDGSKYRGWSKQPHVPTVQGVLESSLSKLGYSHFHVKAFSRTDACVSALGQVVYLTVPRKVMLAPLNRVLPEDVAVTHTAEAAGRVVEKVYVYFYPRKWTNPATVRAVAKELEKPDLSGKLFRKGGSTPKEISGIELHHLTHGELVYVHGKGFGYEQVRRIVGALEYADRRATHRLEPAQVRPADPCWLALADVKVDARWSAVPSGIEKAKDYMKKRIWYATVSRTRWNILFRLCDRFQV